MGSEGEKQNDNENQDEKMLTSIIVTAVIAVALGYALRPGGHDELIVHRPYNNRHNDASGAREDALFE
jgi:hypothetical protein